jgi:hypothetical protein
MITPAIVGTQRSASVKPLRFVQVANKAPPKIEMIWTAPKGIFRRMVWKELKPKELMIKGPKVVMPPLGMLTEKIKANQQ